MIRSFHYAVYTVVFKRSEEKQSANNQDLDTSGHGTGTRMFPGAFLKSYLRSARQELFLPKGPDELRLTLDGVTVGKGNLRVGVRAQQSTDLGQDSAGRHGADSG
jgi:hypothetical protein